MIRQIVIAAVLGMGLAACGVGADEDINTLGQSLENATSQDPVPPKVKTTMLGTDQNGNTIVVTVGSPGPASPGETKASSQDPVPPKFQTTKSANLPPHIWTSR
jgi:predicted small secreted protein